jgi:hypothetical protein
MAPKRISRMVQLARLARVRGIQRDGNARLRDTLDRLACVAIALVKRVKHIDERVASMENEPLPRVPPALWLDDEINAMLASDSDSPPSVQWPSPDSPASLEFVLEPAREPHP